MATNWTQVAGMESDTLTNNVITQAPTGVDPIWTQTAGMDGESATSNFLNTVNYILSDGTPTGNITVLEGFELEQTKVVYGGNF